MPDTWRTWDERFHLQGRADRVAAELSDEEILNLLADERGGRRDVEKQALKREALQRLSRRDMPPPAPADARGDAGVAGE